jgi:hypothetical protein
MDLVAITESWLHKDIDDILISISGCNIHRNDRTGGGVCLYSCQRRLDLENPIYKCLWLWIRSTRLPRPLSAIAVCVVYNPPPPPGRSAEEQRDCRITFLGDFKNFDVSHLTRSLSLKQIVSSPTLDLVINDLHDLYDKPCILAPLGSADHNIIHTIGKQHPKPIKRFIRPYPP